MKPTMMLTCHRLLGALLLPPWVGMALAAAKSNTILINNEVRN